MTGERRAVAQIVERLGARRQELGDAAPRFGLFLCDCLEPAAIRKTVDRIPEGLDDWLEEIVVMSDSPSRIPPLGAWERPGGRRIEPRIHRPPRDSGYGGVRKGAFEYALLKGFDQIIVMRGDGSDPPEMLPRLVERALEADDHAVLAGVAPGRGRPGAERPFVDRLGSFVFSRILGMRLRDPTNGFRLYPGEALRRIPFQLNARGRSFDSEVLLQLRALGVEIDEEPLADGLDRLRDAEGGRPNWLACGTALAYRLHQAHVTRDGRFLVDHDIHYTLKQSPTGSHVQIVEAIEPGSRVLDLGCATGLLAKLLLEKNVHVTGVDAAPGTLLAKELGEYHQRDLELPLELPFGRVFDCVVCADVIEHLRNRSQLLRGARRYLKPDGKLVISTPNIALWFYRLSLLAGRFEYGPRGVLDETHVHLYTGSTFRREVENAGFAVTARRVTALPFEVVFESTGRSRLVRCLASSYHWLARLWPSMFAYQYVLEARITTLDEDSTAAAPANGAREPGSDATSSR